MKILGRVWNAWKRFGQLIGDLVGRVVLTIFYFTIFMPFGLGVRLLSDPLAVKRGLAGGWLERKTRDRVLDDARRLS